MPDTLKLFSPAVSSWNLAHICTLLPESLSIFATPYGCGRVIMMSAAEKGLTGRFAHLGLTREQLMMGETEQAIISGACELLNGLPALPPALMIFTSCVDNFVASDHEVYLSVLRKRYPSVAFLDCAMDPINRETLLPPVVRMQFALSSLWKKAKIEKAVNFFGCFTPPHPDDPLVLHLQNHGYEVRHLALCKTFSEHVAMGDSALNLVTHPTALPAAKELDIPYLYMPVCYDDAELAAQYEAVCAALELPLLTPEAPDFSPLAGWRIVIDDGATWRPFSLAKRLLSEGIAVTRIFADAPAPPEQAVAKILTGFVDIVPNTPQAVADMPRFADPSALAVGCHAAYMTDTNYYLPLIAFGGDGRLPLLARQLTQAAAAQRPSPERFDLARGCCL